ncbi:hypothetical protein MA16_Dca027176 [Dendrobium catenatum]|uniref:Ubiquitin-like protease family profile domain-containing protein n=1 Tax=Dendrobium catenatum TaxID=906689 RepID=A0A2I0V7Z6_9ASPA|nr:hypothetical protein MA16_Dca027176 [Dendrobium catenatum]
MNDRKRKRVKTPFTAGDRKKKKAQLANDEVEKVNKKETSITGRKLITRASTRLMEKSTDTNKATAPKKVAPFDAVPSAAVISDAATTVKNPKAPVSGYYYQNKENNTTSFVENITRDAVKNANLMFVPIINERHWTLLVANLKTKNWDFMDSIPKATHKAIAPEVNWLCPGLLPCNTREKTRPLRVESSCSCSVHDSVLAVSGQSCDVNRIASLRLEGEAFASSLLFAHSTTSLGCCCRCTAASSGQLVASQELEVAPLLELYPLNPCQVVSTRKPDGSGCSYFAWDVDMDGSKGEIERFKPADASAVLK